MKISLVGCGLGLLAAVIAAANGYAILALVILCLSFAIPAFFVGVPALIIWLCDSVGALKRKAKVFLWVIAYVFLAFALLGISSMSNASPKKGEKSPSYTCVNGKVHKNGKLWRDSNGKVHSCT